MTYRELQNNQAASAYIGSEGERFVLAYEHKRLPEYLHADIVHHADNDVAMGYDILSFNAADSIKADRFIEVKTYRGHKHFYWSEGEITAAQILSDHYFLYLVDYDRILDPSYQPEIIQNPARLFDLKEQWISRPINYVFSELASQSIPADWLNSITLIGCYNSQEHLQWILKNNRYNVRAKQFADAPSPYGEVHISNPRVQQARYLLLYQIGVPQNFMFFELAANPRPATRQQLIQSGYPNPHMQHYVVHTIVRRLPSFYVNLQQLFREALPKIDNAKIGQPLYLAGPQFTHFMPLRFEVSTPVEAVRRDTRLLEKRGTLWSDQEDHFLLTNLRLGTSIAEIAKKLYRTEKAVTRRMERMRDQNMLPIDLFNQYHATDLAFQANSRFRH